MIMQEDTAWKQRSIVNWMKQGDRNMSFFHNIASRRLMNNMIKTIKNLGGNWLEEQDVQEHIESFFRDIFRSSNPLESHLEECTAGLNSKLDTDMIQELLKPYMEDEITEALFHMAPYKSPGPDGLLPLFFQKY
ncbi:UNVERIFIED_CONTAM: hypothetical protein Slati_1467600 [Sesamum latifolium]|uniref:Reverse transcriptase n=1 Tax=Sesamum latifolium TaxID=2727402 RepID=A0AAW2X4I7_9LAMI